MESSFVLFLVPLRRSVYFISLIIRDKTSLIVLPFSSCHKQLQINELKRAIETESKLVKEKEAAATSMQQEEANLRAEVALLKARKEAAEATLLELPSVMNVDQVHVHSAPRMNM